MGSRGWNKSLTGFSYRARIWSLRSTDGNPLIPPALVPPSAHSRPITSQQLAEARIFGGTESSATSAPSPSLLTRSFAEPVPVLKFADRQDTLGVYLGDKKSRQRQGRTRIQNLDQMTGMTRAGLPALWIGSGPMIECFDFGQTMAVAAR